MLDAWIIEELRREERERQQEDRPVVELPLYLPVEDRQEMEESPVPSERGVVIIDMLGG